MRKQPKRIWKIGHSIDSVDLIFSFFYLPHGILINDQYGQNQFERKKLGNFNPKGQMDNQLTTK